MLVHVGQSELGEPKVARACTIRRQLSALTRCRQALPPDAQHALRALVLVARGDFGAKEWERAVTQASGAPDAPVEFLTGQAKLHEDLEKGIYELKLA